MISIFRCETCNNLSVSESNDSCPHEYYCKKNGMTISYENYEFISIMGCASHSHTFSPDGVAQHVLNLLDEYCDGSRIGTFNRLEESDYRKGLLDMLSRVQRYSKFLRENWADLELL